MEAGDALLARPIAGLLPLDDARRPIRVLIASLAPGGAERIVLDWLGAEARRGRGATLAVLHARGTSLRVPRGVGLAVRRDESPLGFIASLARAWREDEAPVSTHLVGDDHLEMLWREGVRTVPVVHNSREGWRNDPARWRIEHVPMAVACAESVRAQMIEAGCIVPVVTLRHAPRPRARAFDPEARRRTREALGVPPGTFLVGAVGSLKPQKRHARAVEVLARLCRRRDAMLVIVGGILDRAGLRELDALLDAAIRHRVSDRLRLPGFTDAIEPYLAACDAIVNVSAWEGLSIATQEALAAGLPVVATAVGGQCEIVHSGLELVAPDAPAEEIAARLARHPVREVLEAHPVIAAHRAWSLTLAPRTPTARIDTLLVTANLNAGGAQRSLVHLACAIGRCHRIGVAVCGESTHAAFARELSGAGIDAWQVAVRPDAFEVAESLLAHAQRRGARTVCFWNADAKVKLLVAKLAPPALRLVDASPGAYAFEELESAAVFAGSIGFAISAYYGRLDVLVLKYPGAAHPAVPLAEVIENGVALRDLPWRRPAAPRFLVSGRIAPSKRLETIVEAFGRVWGDHRGAELHVFGSTQPRDAAYLTRIEAMARAMPVVFRGDGASLAHLEESFTATAVLGTHQGSPNAVLEAMAARIPVIANASGGTAAMLDHSRAGWLLREDASVDDLELALREVIGAPLEARDRAEHAHAIARDRHGIARMAQRYLAVFEGGGHGKIGG
jgi:glycosyltransferase involved in cell wall biosynthesis